MTWLKLVPAWAWWLLALVLVAGGQQVRVYSAQAELANYRAEVSERDRRAAMAVLAENQRRQKAADDLFSLCDVLPRRAYSAIHPCQYAAFAQYVLGAFVHFRHSGYEFADVRFLF